MNGCDLWVALAVTILKIVLALLDMAKARRAKAGSTGRCNTSI